MQRDYLRTKFRAEKQLSEDLHRLVMDLLDQFEALFQDSSGWPYRLQHGEAPKDPEKLPDNYSFSTNSMIAYALASASGAIEKSALMPLHGFTQDEDETARHARRAAQSFVLTMDQSKQIGKQKKHVVSTSVTYGDNDPFTLTWMIELGRAITERPSRFSVSHSTVGEIKGFIRKVEHSSRDRTSGVLAPSKAGDRRDSREKALSLASSDQLERRPLRHLFPLLRVLHLAGNLEGTNQVKSDVSIRKIFSDVLHLQLSYYEIPGSPFDVGELVFALEGFLLIEPAIDPATVERAFRVIGSSQEHNPYWRPLRPIIASHRGLVLLPLSVEVANSLLRVCYQVDEEKVFDHSSFSKSIDLFVNYANWLRSRLVRISLPSSVTCIGWHSEHVLIADSIDLWETSQVLQFYVFFEGMLQRHIASRALDDAKIFPILPKVGERRTDLALSTWDKAMQEREPLPYLPDHNRYKIYQRIATEFIQSWSSDLVGAQKPYSLLLFGPPGTGKTSLAKGLAKALGWPFIHISPSDFIAEGPSAVEARAKDIFVTLLEQSNSVIFFDEIDRLILDRDSKLYQRQDDMFQFMTPSMLTKLQDLHDAKQSIFIVGTNYAERIDPAIKRAGRIDHDYLVLSPSCTVRRRDLIELVSEGLVTRGVDQEVLNRFKTDLQSEIDSSGVFDDLEAAVRYTVLGTYGELEQLVRDALQGGELEIGSAFAALSTKASTFVPIHRLENLLRRFKEAADVDEEFLTVQEPLEELMLTAYLLYEVDFPIESTGQERLENVLRKSKEARGFLDALSQGGGANAQAVSRLEAIFGSPQPQAGGSQQV